MKFRLTYQTVTEESARHGVVAHHGFVSRTGNFNPAKNYFPKAPAEFRLRDAVRIFQDHGGSVEADSCPISRQCPPRWFNACRENCGHDYPALSVTLGLHIPKTATASTSIRIARYLKCYGLR